MTSEREIMNDILDMLKALDEARGDEIEQWFAAKRRESRPFFYGSVDLRHSGYKLAPVDTNLFPAGFNNISPAAKNRSVRFMRDRLAEMKPAPKRVLIIPENHTRNLYYLENLAVLAGLVADSGVEVRIGSLVATEPLALASASGR